ncbi:hypothetical protein ATANTOWER_030246 [Ataeniobius toweri]|uniref:Uncharacterized protein n=1 Tax=Ataeniobius toweri TaxID=208326 RepID=A0ABU7ATL4_9TELE|nr:hypothetical protein [Ataeniobius toweri]
MKTRKMIHLLGTIKGMTTIFILNSLLLNCQRNSAPLGQGPYTTVDGIKNFCNKKNTEVMIGTSNVVSDISENILAITEERPTLANLIIHFGAMDDVGKKKLEVLKEDFLRLLSKVGGLNIKVLFSRPFAPFELHQQL